MSGHQKTEAGAAASRTAGRNVRLHRCRASLGAALLAGAETRSGLPMSTQIATCLETGVSGGYAAMNVDALVAFAAALGVRPEGLLALLACGKCGDLPPEGFACRACGGEG